MTSKNKDRTADLSERTLAEKPDTLADKQTGLGKPAPRVNAVRKPATAAGAQPLDPKKAMELQFLQRLNTDLTSNNQPTLAQRVAKEGIGAYGGDYKTKKKPAKSKEKTNAR